MGLGKTAQVIAFLAVLKEKKYHRPLPHMVIVPASLLENWQRELKMWCPALRVVLFHGERERRLRGGAEYCKTRFCPSQTNREASVPSLLRREAKYA
jgi:SWI/SNF-related matrix-associated actin-dependent regulator 1 of chromatin subfamily A